MQGTILKALMVFLFNLYFRQKIASYICSISANSLTKDYVKLVKLRIHLHDNDVGYLKWKILSFAFLTYRRKHGKTTKNAARPVSGDATF